MGKEYRYLEFIMYYQGWKIERVNIGSRPPGVFRASREDYFQLQARDFPTLKSMIELVMDKDENLLIQ